MLDLRNHGRSPHDPDVSYEATSGGIWHIYISCATMFR